MATASPIMDIRESGADLARKTVFIKVHLGLLGNTRKVSSSQVKVDADKALILVSKRLLASPELQAIRTLDGEIRRCLYDTCLPFEVGIHLLPVGLLETVDEKLRDFRVKRGLLAEIFLDAYPRMCQEAVGRLRTLHNPADYPPMEEVSTRFLGCRVLVVQSEVDGERVSFRPSDAPDIPWQSIPDSRVTRYQLYCTNANRVLVLIRTMQF